MYSVLLREIIFAKDHLSNGDRIRLAAFLLDGCSPAPRTKFGKLFDTCVKSLHFLIDTYENEVRKKK